jgi:surface carbohydrate biosynthesis protein
MSKFLYMPIEIAARELDSRLLISLFAVKEGLEVVIGPKWLLQKNVKWVPKGFWIFKTLTPGDAKYMRRAQKVGHQIGAIDEEMPGLGESSHQLRWVDQSAVQLSDTIFCQGKQHQDVLKKAYPEKAERLIITGNPRWDLLRPELRELFSEEVKAITSRLGRIILINTNAGLINSAKKSFDGHVKDSARDGRLNLNLEEDRCYVDDDRAFQTANLTATPPLARRLSKEFPEYTVVLRPHPNEDVHFYETALKDISNVKIIREGSVVSWLLASDALIHTGCTTASEAFALGKPAISFETKPSPFHNYLLSGAFSTITKDENDLIERLKATLSGVINKSEEDKRKGTFTNFFASQSGTFAAQKIAHYIAHSVDICTRERSQTWKRGILFRKKWWPSAHQRRMFPLITADEIKERLQTLAGPLGSDPIPHIDQLGGGQFRLYL